MAPASGARVEVTTALGERVVMRAVSAREKGANFDVVWVVTEDDFDAAQASGAELSAIPWPADSVKVLDLA